MNIARDLLSALQSKGWTVAAIGGELGVPLNTVIRWKAGLRRPANAALVRAGLRRLLGRKRVPKKKRHGKGN